MIACNGVFPLFTTPQSLSSRNGRENSDAIVVGNDEILFFDNAVHDGHERPQPQFQKLVQALYRYSFGRIDIKLLLPEAGQIPIITF
jgi:hypothetical protein